ncbi:MAG: DUF2282 domain-containing protein [Pseudomonadota bacterium]
MNRAGIIAGASLAALGTVILSADADAQSRLTANKVQKCYGVVKAGANDCANEVHSCARQSSIDGDPNEWMYITRGQCGRLVSGSLQPRD